jgi:hypothetical protein
MDGYNGKKGTCDVFATADEHNNIIMRTIFIYKALEYVDSLDLVSPDSRRKELADL